MSATPGGIQSLQKYSACFRDAVAIRIAQQGDAISACYTRTGTFHHPFHNLALDACAVFRLGRRIGFGNQHIAVGKHIEPAWVIEAGCKGVHRKASGSSRCASL